MRIPAIYRPEADGQIEHLVWIIAFVAVPRLKVVTVDGQGTLRAIALDELEVVGWPDDDEALKLHRPPAYGSGDAKIRSISDRPSGK